MKHEKPEGEERGHPSVPDAPLTVEGFAILHQMFRVRRGPWRALATAERRRVASDASARFGGMARREDGESAIYSVLGHKADLLFLHFRRRFEDLARAEAEVTGLQLADYFEPVASYLSVIELGLYEASVTLYEDLAAKGIEPYSREWSDAVAAELERQRTKLVSRLYPKVPQRRYLCFYPMDKKREGADNWYRLPIERRRDLMREHGMVGRRYGGQVTQIISGSTGFDDWEWGVDLFADDPVVFKKLVYEMRFDEASAGYGKFGPFCFGIRMEPAELAEILDA